MLHSKHFKTEQEMLNWVNQREIKKAKSDEEGKTFFWVDSPHPDTYKIISIVKDVTNGDWILFWQTI